MEATRVRFAPVLEWLCAAAIIGGLLVAGLAAIREFHDVRAVTPVVMAHEAPVPDAPPVLAPRAVSLPILLLADGQEIRIGDRASQILDKLGRWAQVGTETIEREGASERITRLYSYAGTQFALVFEALRPDTAPRVVAIYRQ
jgi:hypothetical protein